MIRFSLMEDRTIKCVNYDPQRCILEIELWNSRDRVYYLGVPEEIWYKLKETNTPAAYLRKYIRGKYREEKLRR
ncbi:MAG: KTSC domain-containing protein [Lachnospiraceae bacterium]|nr:KTSC domain-containing protein [Lachnospiraceae bacterium]